MQLYFELLEQNLDEMTALPLDAALLRRLEPERSVSAMARGGTRADHADRTTSYLKGGKGDKKKSKVALSADFVAGFAAAGASGNARERVGKACLASRTAKVESAPSANSRSFQAQDASSSDGFACISLGKTLCVAGVVANCAADAHTGVVTWSEHSGMRLRGGINVTVHCNPNMVESSFSGFQDSTDEASALSGWLTDLFHRTVPVSAEVLDRVDLVECLDDRGKPLPDDQKPHLVWCLDLHVYCLTHDGNLRDAATLAALSALAATTLPRISLLNGVPVIIDEKQKSRGGAHKAKRLQLQSLPVSCSFAAVDGLWLADPTLEEEAASTGSLSLVIDAKQRICSMQKTGLVSVSRERLQACLTAAAARAEELRAVVLSAGHD